MPRRTIVRREGIELVFTHDPADPRLLHIYARHLTTIADALGVWFDEAAGETWNDQFRRFETRNATHVLYWTWLVPEQRVLVITCFRRDD